MIPPVKKNNNGSYWVSEEYYFNECSKYETKLDELKEIIKRLKDENYELVEENNKMKQQIVKLLN